MGVASLAPPGRGPHRGAGAHGPVGGAGAFVVVAVVGWLVVGVGVDACPSATGDAVTGGMRISPEFFAILFALVIYTASHIAEIVRGSIQAVARGQGEAADALALSRLPAAVVRRAARRRSASPCRRSATSTST